MMKKVSPLAADLFRSIIVAVLIPFTFACTGMSIFIANSTEMPGTISSLVPVLCALVGIVALCLFFVQFPFLFIKKSWFVTINSLLLGCGVLLWLQANVFNWNFGELDGEGVNWAAFQHLMILEIVVYAAVIGLVIWKRRWLNQYVVPLACLLIFMQSAPLARPMANELISVRTKQEITSKCPDAEPTLDPNIPAWKQYEITYDGFFDYSPEQNVVLIIPDGFGTALFQQTMKKHPEVQEWFSDFNFFSKHRAEGTTLIGIPQLLTGGDYVPSISPADDAKSSDDFSRELAPLWNAEGALQKTLAEAGFISRSSVRYPPMHHWDHQWISNIRLKGSEQDRLRSRNRWDGLIETGIGYFIDLALVRSLPVVCKPSDIDHFDPLTTLLQKHFASTPSAWGELQKRLDVDFAKNLNENPASATSSKPVLSVIHLQGAHAHFEFNENFETEAMNDIEGAGRQAFATLRLIKRLIDDLKQVGVYDNTLIVIAADHGSHWHNAMCVVDNTQYYKALLLVKRRNERHDTMVDHNGYTHVRDVTPTILADTGLPNPPGRFSVFDIPPKVLTQRVKEYEAFWAKHCRAARLQIVNPKKGGMPSGISSEIVLKQSDLRIYEGQLRWYVGDNLDVWNDSRSKREAIIVMSPANEKIEICYQGTASLNKWAKNKVSCWFSTGIIETQNVADGDYAVEFLLPKKDGTYARNVLGTVTVASGTASVVSETSAVALETTTVR